MIKYREDMKIVIDFIKGTEDNKYLQFVIDMCESEIKMNNLINNINNRKDGKEKRDSIV